MNGKDLKKKQENSEKVSKNPIGQPVKTKIAQDFNEKLAKKNKSN